MKRLPLLFLARTQGRVDWNDVERAWGIPHPEICLHRLLEKLKAPGRERTAWRKIHERMRERQVPSKNPLYFRVAPTAPKDIALRAVKRQILGAELDRDLATWRIQNITITHEAPRTFFAPRNAGAVVRAGKLEGARLLMKDRQEEVVSGSLPTRVPGCTNVPIRGTPHDGVEEVRGASTKMRGMLEKIGVPPTGWKPRVEKWIGSGVRFRAKDSRDEPSILEFPTGHMGKNTTDSARTRKDKRREETEKGTEKERKVGASAQEDPPKKGADSGKEKRTPGPYRPTDEDHERLRTLNPRLPPAETNNHDEFAGRFMKLPRAEKEQKDKRKENGRKQDGRKPETENGKSTRGGGKKGSPFPVAACAEDKSPKGTWLVEPGAYFALCVWMALVASWSYHPLWDLAASEFLVRKFWAVHLPPRFRRYVGVGLRWGGKFIPYFYCTVKLKCFGGAPSPDGIPGVGIHTCAEPGHSYLRKVVSYFRIWGRPLNHLIHRAAQVMLMPRPTWDVWSLSDAPKLLNERYEKLAWDPKYVHRCACCGRPKKPATSVTLDASHAYEQTDIALAIRDLIWAAAWVWCSTGLWTVAINQEHKGSSFLGGTLPQTFGYRASFVVVDFAEISHYIWIILSITIIQIGGGLWVAPGVTIGNPFGRIALAAATGREEYERDQQWKSATMPGEKFNKLCRAGWKRHEAVYPL